MPYDLFDHDHQNTPVLATIYHEGHERRVAFGSGKHGYVVAVDGSTGTELWRTAVGEHENDDLQTLPATYVRVAPGMFGGIESPIAVADGAVFAAVLNLSTEFNNAGYNFASMSLSAARGEIVALDAETGARIWKTELSSGPFGAGPTIANDVVFVGALDGVVRTFATSDGRLLWSRALGVGLNAPFAIAGDMLFVPAGASVVGSSDFDYPGPGLRATPSLVAFRCIS